MPRFDKAEIRSSDLCPYVPTPRSEAPLSSHHLGPAPVLEGDALLGGLLRSEGPLVGGAVGIDEGSVVGRPVGGHVSYVGASEGCPVGVELGTEVGAAVGGVVGSELGTADGSDEGTAVANVGDGVANVGADDTEAAAQVAVIACASHDESTSNSQLVDTAAAARSPSGSARRYSS